MFSSAYRAPHNTNGFEQIPTGTIRAAPPALDQSTGQTKTGQTKTEQKENQEVDVLGHPRPDCWSLAQT